MVENLDENSIDMGNPNKLFKHKIVFVGDIAVGKTSIIFRLLENQFKESYEVYL
jgi:GTPase SAR1 family protein